MFCLLGKLDFNSNCFKVVDDFDEVVVLGVTPVGRNFLDRRNKN